MNPAYLLWSIRRALRQPRFLIFTIALPVLLYLAIGTTTKGTVAGIPFAEFYMVNMAIFGGFAAAVNSGARIAIERDAGWLRTLRLTPLTPRDYVLSKALLSIALAVPSILIVCAAALTVGGVRLPLTQLGEFVVFAILSLIPFAALGIAIGYAANSETAQALTAIAFNLLAFLGGTWYDISTSPRWLQDIAHDLPSYWANVAARSPFSDTRFTIHGLSVMVIWTLALLLFAWRRYQSDVARSA
jgi:ABC-2 type transport system permease protein